MVAAALGAGLSCYGGSSPSVALAAAHIHTSVTVQLASPHTVAGRLLSQKTSCVKRRVVRLQARTNGKWVTVSTTKSNSVGRFTLGLRGAGTGTYRVAVIASHSCGGVQSVRLGVTGASAPSGGSSHGTAPSAPGAAPSVGGTTGPTGTTGTTGTTPVSTGAPSTQARTCTLPLTHDAIDGFHIAVPNGWELSTLRGELEVSKDAAGDEGVIVAPALETSGVTPTSYFQAELSSFESQSAASGQTITVTGNGTQGGQPTASFTTQANGEPIEGTAMLVVRQSSTQPSSQELDFVAYWAPQSAFATEAGTLSAVAACYGTERGSVYQVFQDQAFTYIMPAGWTVHDESQDAIDLTDNQGDVVSYEQVLGSPSQFTTPQSLINLILSDASVLSVTPLWNQQGSGTDYEEFTGTWNGQQVHGLMFAYTDTSASVSTGYYRAVIATAANWNALNGPMIQMAGGIQHNFTQDLQEINQLNEQWQNFDGQVANFDDTLNNQQLVQDPTTGKLYEAPYGSYQDGPQGPGYYLNDQLLNQVERQ